MIMHSSNFEKDKGTVSKKLEYISTAEVLTLAEAHKYYFQEKISKDKLYSEVRAGRIPHVRIGSKILFRRDTLNAWFKQQEQKNLS